MKYLIPIIIAIGALLSSCASAKRFQQPPPTLAQICADSFPSKVDTVIQEHWQVVNFPVPELDTIFIDSVDCPPNLPDAIRVPVKVAVRVPGKTVQVPVLVRDTTLSSTDLALKQAYEDLKAHYKKAINDLENCQTDKKVLKAKKKAPTLWLWMVVIGLISIILIQLLKKK